MTTCLNCENDFEGAFCNQCGQKASTHRFTMHEWLHEIPHSILHVDSGFFVTLKTLFLRPGHAIREYLHGKRKLLFSPFLYLLLMCGVYAVVSYVFESSKLEKQIDSKNFAEVITYFNTKYYKVIVVAMVVPVSLASWLAYYRSGYNFAENLVLNCYLIGQMVIADMILAILAFAGIRENYSAAYAGIDFLLKFPFWFWLYWQFFKPSKWYWGILQFILCQIISGITLALMINGAALIVYYFKAGH